MSPILGLATKSFVRVDETTGMIEKIEIGYSGDTVKEMYNVIYYPIAEYNDEEIGLFEQSIKASFAEYEVEGFCSIEYSTTSTYMIISLHFIELNKLTNINKLNDMGLLSGTSFATEISAKQTETGLIASGYIKR